jgi:tRNA (mo5U34)-methyltransferase
MDTLTDRLDPATKRRLVDEAGPWHHSIDLGDGVVTPGGKTLHHHHDELLRMQLPPLAGKSVLDIGAWDGYYTFMAEGAAASRVIALDHYAWSIDYRKATEYTKRQYLAGQPIRAFHTVPELWDPVGLPGKRGFDVASRALNSRAEVVVGDFMTLDLDALGTFDVVLFLGVIYHLEEPLRGLRRVRQVTGGLAVIETEAISLPHDGPLWEFVGNGRLNNDPTIFWLPTAEGLCEMCTTAGFSQVAVTAGPPRTTQPTRYRAVVHASV